MLVLLGEMAPSSRAAGSVVDGSSVTVLHVRDVMVSEGGVQWCVE